MNENSKFKLGLFFCFAIFIFFAAITLFGVFDYFSDKGSITTIFSESVTGLSLGSSVKYQGVPIGTVKDIFILNDRSQICVKMDIDLDKLRFYDSKTQKTTIPSKSELYKWIDSGVKERGLRCTMQFEGIAGGKYIQIDNREDGKPVEKNFDLASLGLDHVCFIPAEHSTLVNLLASFSSIADSLKALDYKAISDQFTTLLKDGGKLLESGSKLISDGNDILTSGKLKDTLDKINKITGEINEVSANVNKTLTPERLKQIADDITDTTESIRKTSKSITDLSNSVKAKTDELDVKDLSEETKATLKSFRNTADSLEQTMLKLNNGIGSIIELIEHLENDPHFILRGNSGSDAD